MWIIFKGHSLKRIEIKFIYWKSCHPPLYCMENRSLDILASISFFVSRKKESHTAFERYEGEQIMAECPFVDELSL